MDDVEKLDALVERIIETARRTHDEKYYFKDYASLLLRLSSLMEAIVAEVAKHGNHDT